MVTNQECIDVCNSLLRGELSAVETYTQALGKFENDPLRSDLDRLRADHEASASALRQHLVDMGAEPDESSGAWGTFARTVEGTAKILGESPALAALEEGEEHGINEYREALDNGGVMEDIKMEIRQTLLPRLNSHISVLEAMRNR
jgi:hypothetical protein